MSNVSLLYAEDDCETRENYSFVLKKYFKKIYLAENGKDALNIYYAKSPDILLLDFDMPKINGLDLVKNIREHNQKIPIIMLTAHSDRGILLKAVELKLEHYLLKPIDDSKLRHTLEMLIHKIEFEETIKINEKLVWNKINLELFYEGQSIKLTKKETILMKTLSSSFGKYLSKDTLIFSVWYDEIPDHTHDNKLVQLVYRFNKKVLSLINCKKQLIENSYALGYRLNYCRRADEIVE